MPEPLPMLVILERHWDTIPTLFLSELLPNLKKLGYQCVTGEFPEGEPCSAICERIENSLHNTRQYRKTAITYLKKHGIEPTPKIIDFINNKYTGYELSEIEQRILIIKSDIKDL